MKNNSKNSLEKELKFLTFLQTLIKLKSSEAWLYYLGDYRIEINEQQINLVNDRDDSMINLDEKSKQELESISSKPNHWLFTFCGFTLKELYLLYLIPVTFFTKNNLCIFKVIKLMTSKKHLI